MSKTFFVVVLAMLCALLWKASIAEEVSTQQKLEQLQQMRQVLEDEEAQILSSLNEVQSDSENFAPSAKFAGMVTAHNKYRKTKNLPALKWNDSIAKYAQSWANHLKSSNKCNMKHRQPNKYGENLAWAFGQNLSATTVVKMWYDEISFYNYGKNSCQAGKMCGHFTQVMWKKTKEIGCGYASCGNTEIWVCNYNPPGNYIGQKPW